MINKFIICLIHAHSAPTNMTKEVSSSRYRSTYAIVMCSIIIIDPSDVFLDVCNVCNAVAVFLATAVTCIFMWRGVLSQNVLCMLVGTKQPETE